MLILSTLFFLNNLLSNCYLTFLGFLKNMYQPVQMLAWINAVMVHQTEIYGGMDIY